MDVACLFYKAFTPGFPKCAFTVLINGQILICLKRNQDSINIRSIELNLWCEGSILCYIAQPICFGARLLHVCSLSIQRIQLKIF